MLFEEVARASLSVAETSARSAKIKALAACLRRARREEVPVVVTYLSGTLPRIGVGWTSLRDLPEPAAPPATLGLLGVDGAVGRIAALQGPRSQARRKSELAHLFARATEPEQGFLSACSSASCARARSRASWSRRSPRGRRCPRRRCAPRGDARRRAVGRVARAALERRAPRASRDFRLAGASRRCSRCSRSRPSDIGDALDALGTAPRSNGSSTARACRSTSAGDEVRVYTRSLNDVTAAVPEIVEALEACRRTS